MTGGQEPFYKARGRSKFLGDHWDLHQGRAMLQAFIAQCDAAVVQLEKTCSNGEILVRGPNQEM